MTQQEKYSFHLPYKPVLTYIDCLTNRNRKAFLTGVSEKDVETTYKRKINGCSGDLISFTGNNNIKELKVKPYFRPFSQLTKECVQDDYNDGKPFVPIEEVSIYSNNSEYLIEQIKLGFVEFIVIRMLLKWHFCLGFETGEYIEVTNENNPYK